MELQFTTILMGVPVLGPQNPCPDRVEPTYGDIAPDGTVPRMQPDDPGTCCPHTPCIKPALTPFQQAIEDYLDQFRDETPEEHIDPCDGWEDEPTTHGVESDPYGKGVHEPGAKNDAGKNRLALVLGGFTRAIQAVGEIGTAGAKKYTDRGWLDVPEGFDRYSDALMRHLTKEWEGELLDPISGQLHAAHAAWNALARLELLLLESEDAEI